MDIGMRIKERRIQLGMSQEELARLLGYKSRSSINKIEVDGRGLPQSKIQLIANILGVSPAYLMGWEDDTGNLAEEQAKILDSIESYDLIRAGLAGYFDEEFSDKEIGKLIRYAKLIIDERE